MKRSGSQSSTSDYSINILDSEFPSYEDLFYRPPMPMPSLSLSGPYPHSHPRTAEPIGLLLDNRVRGDENEGPLRELLDEMRDWFIEHSASEAERRLHKPLPAPPAVERVARRPYVRAHAHTAPVVAVADSYPYPYTDDDESDDDHQLTPKASHSGLHTRAAAAYYAHPAPAPASQKMPTPASASPNAAFPILRRHLADVPHSPFSDAFVDSSPCPSPSASSAVFPQSRLRPRSSSMTLCAPSTLLTARSEVFGAIDRLTQKPTGEVHVHYRNRAVADRVARTHTQVEIAGAGRISLDCACASGRK
ncbi:hypothetical protein M0805_005492 [Coniferiporia weirii]|nr:hypothetical protein M0805_005492 [Coniferiporia weirii]